MGTEATAVIVKPYNEFIHKWLEEGYIIPINSVSNSITLMKRKYPTISYFPEPKK